jgi:hypothetical protein
MDAELKREQQSQLEIHKSPSTCTSSCDMSSVSEPSAAHSQQDVLLLPRYFIMPDVLSIVSSQFQYGINKHEVVGQLAGRDWLHLYVELWHQDRHALIVSFYYSYEPMSREKIDRFLEKGNFARFASMSFPQADEHRFIIAYKFYLWAFLVSAIVCNVQYPTELI